MYQLFSEEDRILVSLKDVPEKLIAVILATEDRDFFNHHGVDYKGIVRAFVTPGRLADARTSSRARLSAPRAAFGPTRCFMFSAGVERS